jgi:hypothetical protein
MAVGTMNKSREFTLLYAKIGENLVLHGRKVQTVVGVKGFLEKMIVSCSTRTDGQ